MKNKSLSLTAALILFFSVLNITHAQESEIKSFTHADTLRGSLLPERAWWNVLRYDITVKPDYETKTISGKNIITYNAVKNDHTQTMQIDLQDPMIIDSILFNLKAKLDFENLGNVWYVNVPEQDVTAENSLLIYFHGQPHESKLPPWEGGWVWSRDSLGNPWISAAAQGDGASLWYPCKDHQSDEPDNGASLTMVVPDDLVGVANGRLKSKTDNNDGTTSFKWEVVNPINNYDIIPYIGKYVNISDTYAGEKGILNVEMWVLDYNVERAKEHILPEIKRMLEAFEHWFGPYPFYEDSYKIIDAPYAGMENQSAIAYGNKYLYGFWGKDRSRSKWGMKFDYMIVHESAHEWFGNSITTNDIADMWVHESFADFSEALFLDYWYGKDAANAYSYGLRQTILNKSPIIGQYGVNDEGNVDMYSKGSNMLNSIRHSIDYDNKFREILRGLSSNFYHKTVDTKQIENFISTQSGFDYSKVFDQYLRTIQIPALEYYFSRNVHRVYFRYADCISGFDLPLVLDSGNVKIKIKPTTSWQSIKVSAPQAALFNKSSIENMYYINVKQKAAKKAG